MKNKKLFGGLLKPGAGLAGVALGIALSGCVAGGGYARYQSGPGPVAVVQDDYDYYPAYEVYYSRTRHEYVYRDGDNWVHRSEYRNASPEALRGTASVHLDFHDAPERHHATVVKQYPRTWKQPGRARSDRDGRKEGEKRDH